MADAKRPKRPTQISHVAGRVEMTPMSCRRCFSTCSVHLPAPEASAPEPNPAVCRPLHPFNGGHVGSSNEQCAPLPANQKKENSGRGRTRSMHGPVMVLCLKGPVDGLHHAGLLVQASRRPDFVVLVLVLVLVLAAATHPPPRTRRSQPGTAGAHLVLPPPCLLPGIADSRHRLARPNAAVLSNGLSHRDGGLDRRHQRYLA